MLVRLVQANTAFQAEHDLLLLGRVAHVLNADVATLVELRHSRRRKARQRLLRLADYLPGYDCVQDTRSLWRSSSAIAVKRGTIGTRRVLATRLASRGTRLVGPRVWREVVLDGDHGPVHVLVSHSPLKRTGLQPVWRRALRLRTRWLTRRGRRWIVGMDANDGLSKVADDLHGTAHGYRIDGYVVSPDVNVLDVRPDFHPEKAGWTDHPLVVMTVDL